MSNPHHLDERELSRLDDLQLEAVRLDLLRSGDERYEQVCERLLVRGIARIECVARELCDLHELPTGTYRAVVVDASVRLQLRLTRAVPLAGIATLATRLTDECVVAHMRAPRTPERRPRLAARPPRLRSVPIQIADAVRSGQLKPKGGPNS